MRGPELCERLLEHARRVVRPDDAIRDESGCVRLADRHLLLDPLGLERLRVRGLVLLVVTEAAVADEVDHDVVPELVAVGERQPDRREGGLGVVGVDVHDRHVEALREVARVARRAALGRIRREPDLVVRDQVERPARRVAVEAGEVEGLGHDSLAREGRVAMDEDRERDRRIVDPRAGGSVRLLGARETLDDGVDRLQVARVRCDGDLDLARVRHARLGRREVVLDVTGAALGIGDEGVDRALAFELTQDRRVRPTDDVGQDVEATAVGDADEHLVRAAGGSQLDGLVEHRHQHVEPLDRELLLTDEGAPQVRLERLDPGESLEERASLLGGQLTAKAAGLDRLAQPDALGVVRDVLDLVRDRPRVDLAQPRKRVLERLARNRESEQFGRNTGLQLGRQRRHQPRLVQGGIPHRLRAERIQPRVEVTVRAIGLHERHRGGDTSDELAVGRDLGRRTRGSGRRRSRSGRKRRRSRSGLGDDRSRDAVAVAQDATPHETLEARERGEKTDVSRLEHGAPRRIDALGIFEVLLEELPDVPGVQAGRLEAGHRALPTEMISRCRCRSRRRRTCPPRRPPLRHRPPQPRADDALRSCAQPRARR